MNPFTTHGAISWHELLAAAPDRALAFYSELFGWKPEEMPMEGGLMYHVMKIHDINVAGVMQRPHEEMPPCWTLYITVDDVRALVDNNDLNLLVPITDTPIGPFCGILDPQGAYIQAIQYADGSSESGLRDFVKAFRTHGLFSWFELRTQDPEAAATYYSNLFGWTIEVVQIPTGQYRIVKIGDVGFGAIVRLPDAEVPPHWCGYVTVDDVDTVVEKTPLLGGTVLFPPMDIPHVGRMTQIVDPEGSSVVAITYVAEEQ